MERTEGDGHMRVLWAVKISHVENGGWRLGHWQSVRIPMMTLMTRQVWLIDDTPRLHTVARATLRLVPGWSFTGYLTGSEAGDAYRAGVCLPQIILMDFFLGDDRGDLLTAHLRAIEQPGHRPVIVGYSSMRSGSEAIVAAGGDVIVVKQHNEAGINPSLLAYLKRWR